MSTCIALWFEHDPRKMIIDQVSLLCSDRHGEYRMLPSVWSLESLVFPVSNDNGGRHYILTVFQHPFYMPFSIIHSLGKRKKEKRKKGGVLCSCLHF